MNHRYILDEHGQPVAEPSLEKWAHFFENVALRKVANDTLFDSRVSTVFLGLDHNFAEGGAPVLWETMVFGGPLDQEQDRCAGGREQAEAMHAAMCRRVQAAAVPKSREEKLEAHIATLIQRGHVEKKTSYEIAEEITDAAEREAEEWRNRPGPGEYP